MDIAHANLDSSLSKGCMLFEDVFAEEISCEIKKQKAGRWSVQNTFGENLFLCRGEADLNQMR